MAGRSEDDSCAVAKTFPTAVWCDPRSLTELPPTGKSPLIQCTVSG